MRPKIIDFLGSSSGVATTDGSKTRNARTSGKGFRCKAHLDALFGGKAAVEAQSKLFAFRYRSPAHMLTVFRTYYGPVRKAFAAIDTNSQQALEAEIIGLIERFNTAEDGTAVIRSEYLEIVISKQG